MVMIIVPNSVIQRRSIPVEVQNYISPHIWDLVTTSLQKADYDSNMWACLIEGSICLCLGFPCIFCCHGCISGAFSDKRRLEKLNNINRNFFNGRPVFSTTDDFGIVINTDFIINDAQIQQAVSTFAPAYSTSSSHIQYAQLNMNDYDAINPIITTQAVSSTPAYGDYYTSFNNNTTDEMPVAVSIPVNASNNTTTFKESNINNNNNNSSNSNNIDTSVTGSSTSGHRVMAVTIPEGAVEGTQLTVAAPGNTIVQVTVPPNVTPGESIQVRY